MKNAQRAIGGAAGLLLLVLLAYARVRSAGFIWDDDAHLTNNVCIVGPAGFAAIWTTAEATYYPLVLTTFWILHQFAGLNPLPYHVLNVLFHAASAILLWRVLRELNVRGAWIGAALWAVHPVMVQSVAWVTEMKNTQSCVFYLLSILFFLKADSALPAQGRRLKLALAVLFAAMAMTSKTSTVILPAVLALCLWWRNKKWQRRDLAALAPFCALAVAASVWTIWEQKFHSGATGSEWAQSVAERAIIAGRDVWFYLGKLTWPHPLIYIYPRWKIAATQPAQYVGIVAVVAVFVFLWLRRARRLRPVLFGFGYFVIALLPVLGFFNVFFFRYSFVSDHFQYLASMGPLALAGAALGTFAERNRFISRGAAALPIAALTLMTWDRTRIYSDATTLWRTTLAQNPDCWMAHYELAAAMRARREIEEAIGEYLKGLAIWPDYADAHYNLAGMLLEKGAADAAVGEYRAAARLQPRDSEVHNNLGSALVATGAYSEAIAEYQMALDLQPKLASARINLADVLLQSGNADAAIDNYREAISIAPAPAKVYANLGAALLRKGQVTQGISEFTRALDLDPNDRSSLTNLSWLLATTADVAFRDGRKACMLAEKANQLANGQDPFAWHSMAAAYAEVGEFSKAVHAAERALELASPAGNSQLVDVLTRELALYRAGTPYHRSR